MAVDALATQGARSSAEMVLTLFIHYSDVIMSTIASQITSLTIVYSTVYSDADQRKHQSSASLAFVRGIHRGPVNSPHKWPVTRKCFHLMMSSCHTMDVINMSKSFGIIPLSTASPCRVSNNAEKTSMAFHRNAIFVPSPNHIVPLTTDHSRLRPLLQWPEIHFLVMGLVLDHKIVPAHRRFAWAWIGLQ